jgi:allophanate hydrolase
MTIQSLTVAYRAGARKPSDIVDEVYDKIAASGERPVWITVIPKGEALARARQHQEDPIASRSPCTVCRSQSRTT